MQYRIEYSGNQKCAFANGRAALLDQLKTAKGVIDIRKIYSNGVSDSVMDRYRNYIEKDDQNKEVL